MRWAGCWCLAGFLLPLAHRAGVEHFWGCLAFLTTGMMVFAASTTVHFSTMAFISSPQLHTLFNNLDHFSIYLFIAGTYTPFVLCAISEPWQLTLIFTVWIIAIWAFLTRYFRPTSRSCYRAERFVQESLS
jgi:hemolysin III